MFLDEECTEYYASNIFIIQNTYQKFMLHVYKTLLLTSSYFQFFFFSISLNYCV
jgi:hypothetical protein